MEDIQVEPKEILVEGTRNELVRTVAKVLPNLFIFNNKGDNVELQEKLDFLKAKFKVWKKSFEYIEDFLNIPAEQIWREEVTRIFRVSLDKEGTKLISKKYNLTPEIDQGIDIQTSEL